MKEAAPAQPNPINEEFHAQRRAEFADAVAGGVVDQSLEQWDHNRRGLERTDWQTRVETRDGMGIVRTAGIKGYKRTKGEEGSVTGEDAAYLAKLREMYEDEAQNGQQEQEGTTTSPDQPTEPENASHQTERIETAVEKQLREQNERLQAQNEQLLERIAELTAAVTSLQEQVGQLSVAQENPVFRQEAPEATTQRIEVVDDTTTEKENSMENLWRREAINPENILDLKDRYNIALAKEMELHANTKDPWLIEASRQLVLTKLMNDHLKIEDREWDQEQLTEIRNDVLHMMSMSDKSLEMLMLKPADEIKAEEIEAKKPEEPSEPSEPVVAATTRKGMGARFRDGFRRGWNAAYVGALSPVTYLATRGIGQDKDGKPIIAAIPEGQLSPDEPEGKERKRRCFWPVLGALALGAAAGYLISRGFHGGGGSGGAVTEVVTPKSGGGAITEVVTPKGGGAAAKEHLETWNNTQSGRRYVQDVLPNNLDQRPINGISGPEGIFDKTTGQPVVEHVTFKESGALSDGSLRQLHKAGYNTDVIRNQIFDTDGGPGPVGLVDKRSTSVVTSNTPKS